MCWPNKGTQNYPFQDFHTIPYWIILR
jgi:hypothetical protein